MLKDASRSDKHRKWQFQQVGGDRILIRKVNKITGCEAMKTDDSKAFIMNRNKEMWRNQGAHVGSRADFFGKKGSTLADLYILMGMIHNRKRK